MALKPEDFAVPTNPIYACSCFGGDKQVRDAASEVVDKLAEHFIDDMSSAAADAGLCAVGTVRVAMRTLIYANTMLMAIMHNHDDSQPKNVVELQLRELMEQELHWADARIKGIDTVYAKDAVLTRTKEHE